jgi:DNA-binding response OmpR family regulator
MPGMNGLDLIDALRSADRLPGHIILISAYSVLDTELNKREIKIDARFSKPVKTEKILHLVRGLLTDPGAGPAAWQAEDSSEDMKPNGRPPAVQSAPTAEENG